MIWLRTPLFGLMPYRLARLLKERVGETGVVVKGWFHRGPYTFATEGWWTVTVVCDGNFVDTVSEGGTRASSCWSRLQPGAHDVEFYGSGRSTDDLLLHRESISLTQGQIAYIAFLPPAPNSARRKPNLRSRWRVVTLEPEDIGRLRRWLIPWYARLPDA
jgi:hypothetical protein